MRQTLAITLNTFREAVRDKVLYGFLFFAAAIILFSLVLGELSLHEEKRISLDMGISGISLFSVIISLYLGVTLVKKEVERKTVFYVLTKPITRSQFIVGKFLGMVWTVIIQILFMFSFLFIILEIQFNQNWITPILIASVTLLIIWFILFWGLKLETHIWVSLFAVISLLVTIFVGKGEVNVTTVLKASLLTICEVFIITSIAIMFSTIATPLMSGIITFGIFIAGRNIQNIELLSQKVKSDFLKLILNGVGSIFPNLYLFYPSGSMLDAKHFSIHAEFVGWRLIGWDFIYAFLYALAVLLIAILIFKRKEFI